MVPYSEINSSNDQLTPSKNQVHLDQIPAHSSRTKYQFEAELPTESDTDIDPNPPYKSKRSLHSYENENTSSLTNPMLGQRKHRKFSPDEEPLNSVIKYDSSPKHAEHTKNQNATDYELTNEVSKPLIEPLFSIDSCETFFSSDFIRNEMVVNNLVITSDYFLNKAHETVLDTNSLNGAKTYFRMIKISIKALLLLIKKYGKCLNPYLELIIYFKLAKIYFTETENLNRADDYVNKAISIATRNNLIKVKFLCEFLIAQILEKSNPRLSVNYLNEKITSFNLVGLHNIGNIFTLLKINNLLSQDPKTGLIVLQSLCLDPQMDNITKALCFIYQSNLHLYRGSPNHSKELLISAENLLLNPESDYPIQLKAMFYLLRYSVYVHTDDHAGSKQIMQIISDFILSEQLKLWNSWEEDGTYRIKLHVPLTNNLNSNLSYQVTWLNSDEFVIMFYFLTGVNFLPAVYNKKNKSKKVFQKCLQILDKQLQELKNVGTKKRTFPLNQLTKKKLRLSYIRYYINYYQVWMNFLHKNFTGIDPLNEFLDNYNNNNFTSDELCCYKLLIPKIIYLFGIYFQYKGDLKAAKYYYMRVRNFTLHKHGSNNIEERISILQSYLGIGGDIFQADGEFSELFVYSTLHLVIITEFEVDLITRRSCNNEQLANERDTACRFRSSLYLDLTNIFTNMNKRTSNSFNMNQAGSNQTLIVTYNLLLCIYGDNYSGKDQVKSETSAYAEHVEILTDAMKTPSLVYSFPYMASLAHYIIYLSSTTLADKESALEKCLVLAAMENYSDNESIINCFILRDYCLQLHERGNHDKGIMIETRLHYLYDLLRNKFELVNSIDKCKSNPLSQ